MSYYKSAIVKFCAERNITNSALGIRAGYNKNYISAVVSETITPTITALESIACALKVNLSDLIFEPPKGAHLALARKLAALTPQSISTVAVLIDHLAEIDRKAN